MHSERNENVDVTILVVDDAIVNRELLKRIFSQDYKVEDAKDGVEALEMLNANPKIDLVVLDLMMPRLDGFEVLEAMQESDNLRDIPVIVITGADDNESQIRALDSGAMDVLLKPFSSRIVQHRVKNILYRKRAQKEAEENRLLQQRVIQAETDPKTGIWNKQAFVRYTRSLLEANPDVDYTLVIWDIDRFKMLNDMYGVGAGDAWLELIGKRSRSWTDQTMTYAHLEADRFVLCMPNKNVLTQKVIQEILALDQEKQGNFEFISRVGIYEINQPSLDIELMIDRATIALKSTKGDYNNRIGVFSQQMWQDLTEEQEITSVMDSALRNGEFQVWLQPQCNYQYAQLHGAEALVRWVQPDGTIINPDAFIPIFEKNGFVTQVDMYLWEQVCRLQRGWLDQNLNVVPISINISRRDIASIDVVQTLQNLLQKYSLDPSFIRVEVTESSFLQNYDAMVETVDALQKIGFEVEMDDFGSGYSSLNVLKDIHVDMLKLDMKFLQDAENNQRASSILTSVVRLANWISLPVLAEGVETKEKADYLKSIGCFYIQGFYYAKPMPADSFESFLKGSIPEKKYIGSYFEAIPHSLDFLTVSTQSAMLFNRFVGGAAILEYDQDHVEALRINDAYYEELGIDPEKYRGIRLNILSKVDYTDKEMIIRAIKQAIETGKETTAVSRIRVIGKEEDVYVRSNYRFLVRNEGRYILYASFNNITTLMNSLHRNEVLNQELTAVMNGIPGGVQKLVLEDDRIVVRYFNQVTNQLFGYRSDEFQMAFGNDLRSVTHPADVKKLDSFVQDPTISTKEQPIEIRFRQRNGQYKWIRLSGALLSKTPEWVLNTIMEDIDQLVKNREIAHQQAMELEHQRMMLKTLYDTISCGILLFDGDPDKKEELIDFNNRVWKMFGYSSRSAYLEAIQDKSHYLNVYKEDLPVMKEALDQTVLTGQPVEINLRILTKDVCVKWVKTVFQNVRYEDGKRVTQVVLAELS